MLRSGNHYLIAESKMTGQDLSFSDFKIS